MRKMEELKELLCDELDMIADKGELTAGSLDTIDKLTHSIKSIETIMAMAGESYEGSYQGGSYRSYARGGQGGRSNRSYRSYARGRGGRSNRGYSRDDDIEERIMDIMEEVDEPKVRQALQKAIEKMEG